MTKNTRFRVGVFPCHLGFVLIAFTEKGVSTVEIGESKLALLTKFNKQFNRTFRDELSQKDKATLSLILQKIENPRILTNIPLDIHGTSFQRKVWKALQDIPLGETRTYSQIATIIDHPTAVRAVANACAQNKIALLIPCHRVIRKNGELGGYKWGLDKKALILKKEQLTSH